MGKRDLILGELDRMNKTINDKRSALDTFEKYQKSWAYGNGYGLNQDIVVLFKVWGSLNSHQTESIKKEFLIDDEIRIILEKMKNDYLVTKAEYAICRLYEDNLSDRLIGRCLNEEEYECLLKAFMDWVFEEGKQLKERKINL